MLCLGHDARHTKFSNHEELRDFLMITDRMRQLIDELTALPPEEQDRVAAAMDAVLRLPSTPSDAESATTDPDSTGPNPVFDNLDDFARYLGMTDEEIAESARMAPIWFPPDEDDGGEESDVPPASDHADLRAPRAISR